MLIICPKCLAQYLVPDDAPLEKMQKFHCSACQGYFTQHIENAQMAAVPPKADENILNENKEPAFDLMHVGENTAGQAENSISLFADDRAEPKADLSLIPEEFQPVPPEKKKSSWLGALLWLIFVGAVCGAVYTQRDFLIQKVDALILNQLDKKKEANSQDVPAVTENQSAEVRPVKIPPAVSRAVREEDMLLGTPLITDSTPETVAETTEIVAAVETPVIAEPETGIVQLEQETPPVAESVLAEPSNIQDVLTIQDVSYAISKNEAGVLRLMIQGVVANTDERTVKLPELKAVVYDDQDSVVARKRIIISEETLPGNSTQSFYSSVVPAPPGGVRRVEVLFDE